MTLSALASTFGGIVRPICLAVFRLITSSNFFGCSTGKIGGLGAFEDSINVIGHAPELIEIVSPIAHQTAIKSKQRCPST